MKQRPQPYHFLLSGLLCGAALLALMPAARAQLCDCASIKAAMDTQATTINAQLDATGVALNTIINKTTLDVTAMFQPVPGVTPTVPGTTLPVPPVPGVPDKKPTTQVLAEHGGEKTEQMGAKAVQSTKVADVSKTGKDALAIAVEQTKSDKDHPQDHKSGCQLITGIETIVPSRIIADTTLNSWLTDFSAIRTNATPAVSNLGTLQYADYRLRRFQNTTCDARRFNTNDPLKVNLNVCLTGAEQVGAQMANGDINVSTIFGQKTYYSRDHEKVAKMLVENLTTGLPPDPFALGGLNTTKGKTDFAMGRTIDAAMSVAETGASYVATRRVEGVGEGGKWILSMIGNNEKKEQERGKEKAGAPKGEERSDVLDRFGNIVPIKASSYEVMNTLMSERFKYPAYYVKQIDQMANVTREFAQLMALGVAQDWERYTIIEKLTAQIAANAGVSTQADMARLRAR